MGHSTCKIVSLAILGAVFIILGILLGKNLILKVITKALMEQKCVDSIQHKSYLSFVSFYLVNSLDVIHRNLIFIVSN